MDIKHTIGIIIILISVITYACTYNKREKPIQKAIISVDNDKIILVKNISEMNIKKALNDFCRLYNNGSLSVLPRLFTLSDREFVVTFPHDLDFTTFCFAVNYLKYPNGIKPLPNVRAWATTKTSDEWITDKSANKKVMLFLATDDKEYDNVFLTTQDEIGYKLGFADGEQKQLLNIPKEQYQAPPVNNADLKAKKFEDFH